MARKRRRRGDTETRGRRDVDRQPPSPLLPHFDLAKAGAPLRGLREHCINRLSLCKSRGLKIEN
jgi:hypothetical protein